MQKTLFDFVGIKKKRAKPKIKPKIKLKPDIDRIFGIRFAEEVPREICQGCKLSRMGHPLVKTKDKTMGGYDETYRKLCIKDALKIGAPIKKIHDSYDYIPEGYYKKFYGEK